MWQAVIVDTVTGVPVDRIPVADASWTRALAAQGDGSATVMLGQDGLDGLSKAALRDLFAPWKRTLVLEWSGAVKYAGIIVGRPYPGLGAALDLTLADLWAMFDRRLAVDRTHAHFEQWKITYSNVSLQTLAKRAVQRGTFGVADPASSLPITLPADVAGTITRTYWGYHAQTVGKVLADLMAEGLDIDFEPRWVDGKLDWLMRVGMPLTGSVRELNPTAEDGNVSGFSEQADAARVANNSILIGEGSEKNTLIRSNRTLGSGLPLLDRVVSNKDISDSAQAQALANRGLVDFAAPTFEWPFEVLMSGAGADLRIADTARMFFDADLWIADGINDRRIVSMAGTLAEAVSVSVQPTGGL